ncbi:MAG: hypothetical protein J6B77_02920 [Clostridia bacterium]|nr:hypothetical protein [Clostridia bacterium]
MRAKCKYTLKYLAIEFLPWFLVFAALSVMLVFIANSACAPSEQFAVCALCTAGLLGFSVYHLVRVCRFLSGIAVQERKYGVFFGDDRDDRTKTYAYGMIVCTRDWVIHAGRFALYRAEIRSVSIGDAEPQKNGSIHPVRIKTVSGKKFVLKCKNEAIARAVRNSFRR